MKTLLAPLSEMAEYEEGRSRLKKTPGIIEINGCVDSQKLHVVYGLGEGYRHKLIVTYSEQRAKEICEDYAFYDRNIEQYGARDLIFYQADVHGNLLTKQRMSCLKPIIEEDPVTIVTTFDALMEHIVPLETLEAHILGISTGDQVDLPGLQKQLVTLGYTRSYQVEESGQFSVRGGIIDIYPLTGDNPVRIELWGDEVESIRSFDVLSQRSIEKLDDIMIFPASEIILTDEEKEAGIDRLLSDAKKYEKKLLKDEQPEAAGRVRLQAEEIAEQAKYLGVSSLNLESYVNYFYDEEVSFLDYFDKENTLLILDEPARLREKGELTETEFRESMENRLKKGYILPGQTDILLSREQIMAKAADFHAAALSALPVNKNVYKPTERFSMIAKSMNSYNNSFEALTRDLKRFKKNGYRVLLLSASRTRAKRLTEDLNAPSTEVSFDEDGEKAKNEGTLGAYYTEDYDREIKPGEVMVSYGRIRRGFEYPLIKFVVISESDIFSAQRKKKKRVKYEGGQKIRDFSELSVGDFVVHESHGLGIYKGIEQVTVDHVTKDYIKIEYRDGGNLYIPATNLDSIQKYGSAGGRAPKLNKLGGSEWTKTKTKVKNAIDVIATDLVDLYAVRRMKDGYRYGEDTVWQTEFEERFPFEETEDQLAAIEATKKDMQSSKIMDRLICGDVGYGKTEIALRAAFKAVQENKQVAYLVPTTILAQQHYNTFMQRMKDYPVRVDMLSRFNTPAQQKKTISDLKKGMVDIVIGTHRLLSKDVDYKDLGLLIIDEEQRFGVRHKETIKKLKENVDVLTLTATPIPRTLHMSLIGIRDMSVLEEAPQDRMPIQTFVMEYNEELVREAINRELARGGQVFYVYNRVDTIVEMTNFVQKLVPDANVAYAHGQMKEQELERIMVDFINGEIDVLVSTTIIETGLDISNVNTMIIHDSDRMGLSQLYQLRGRVGRSNRTAYAFLMYRKDKLLKEVAEKRLQAIRDFTELGSGFKIAMRDLEIRGAGNLLGEMQSGHMEAVGYDLYCKMLNEAVRVKKGIEAPEDNEVSVDINVDAYIPDEYIMNENQKIDIYKRIAGIDSTGEREEMLEELNDRFGELPAAVINLLDIANIRMLAKQVYISDIKEESGAVKFSVYEKAKYDPEKIAPFIAGFKGAMTLKMGEKPYFLYRFPKGSTYENERLIRLIEELLTGMQELKEDALRTALQGM
ncbi:MAG: transcription-repair coupling factor [Lachnospiraceae bacterium]|nr:transcription-repair coupling factor [Lachnospiraceae bacterium]